jgi:hypothetical protein
MPSNSRKNQIKKAITRKPKYGGPQGGRPSTSARVGRARATSGGINYLAYRDGTAAQANAKHGPGFSKKQRNRIEQVRSNNQKKHGSGFYA